MNCAVVKLGGSAATAASLPLWLAAIEASTLPLVIVPGGGPFADAVREAQPPLGFSDRAAHVMALLAMEQFGQVLIDRTTRLDPARGIQDIRTALGKNRIPVWLPTQMALSEPTIPASWDVTSDSLAAWLCQTLDATALVLIKQTDDFAPHDTPETLSARGIVDTAFPHFAAQIPALYLAGPRHLAFARDTLPGERIARAPVRKAG
ncbi:MULTISPECIES: dihydroneopterin aldolase [Mesorhizobium]|uniref:Dihydroneopterin aldolase n=1 Tax=Mesorhizobium denitrificans TaxID=2294114 RepID=A0A371XC72_9HYPH|nr:MULTISPECIES: dihydroneopterin aldolase [Mesorhizobium]RFC66791.1 dihydroneopterin aldolase [Mesorhizobium denitrificans]